MIGDHETPKWVTHVHNCSCGGLDWHAKDCAIWTVPREQALADVEETHARIRTYTEGLR